MMYRHTVTFYDSNGDLVETLDDKVKLQDFGYKKYNGTEYLGGPVEACFSKDKKYLWVSNYSMIGKGFNKEGCDGCEGKHYDPGFLYKVNAKTFKIENVIEVGAVPKYISISRNGRLLIVSNWTSSDISIIDLQEEKEIKRINIGSRPRGVVIDKHNQFAYVTVMGSNKVAVVNLLNYKVSFIQSVGKGPRHLLMNKSNTNLYVSVNSSSQLVKMNLLTKKMQYCKVKSGPRSMVLTKDERWIYVVNYYANTFQKIDTRTFEVVNTISTKHHPIGITFNWHTNDIWVACYSGYIQIFRDHNDTG